MFEFFLDSFKFVHVLFSNGRYSRTNSIYVIAYAIRKPFKDQMYWVVPEYFIFVLLYQDSFGYTFADRHWQSLLGSHVDGDP